MAMEVIQAGKFVSLTYRICDTEGRVLEHNDLPVSYIQGGPRALIGGLEKAVLGKSPGDEVEVLLPPQDAFGFHDPRLTFVDEIENVPVQFRRVGAEVEMQNEAGEVKIFYVTRIENGTLTVDGNHPFAGKTLKVTVRILEVRDATATDQEAFAVQADELH